MDKLAFLFFTLAVASAAPTHPGDAAVLQELRGSLTNGNILGWGDGADPCGLPGWPHVTCDLSGHVTHVDLSDAGLVGALPASLRNLTSLVSLGLQNNNLTGPLPSFRGMASLRHALFGGNRFDAIPADFFSGLANLAEISLDGNPLNASSGGWALPADLATSSPQLQSLMLVKCNLVGSVPEFLAGMGNLQTMALSYNRLSGQIPDGIDDCKNLRVLWLDNNNIVGLVPASLAKLEQLDSVKLDNNTLMGPVPGLKTRSNYSYSGNRFCSASPGAACSPEVMALLGFLAGVGYPEWLASSWNGNDPCASWLGIACFDGRVVAVSLPDHGLNGTISPTLGDLSELSDVRLGRNNLTGTMPESLTRLKALRMLDLSWNNLDPPLPEFNPIAKVNVSGNQHLDWKPPQPPPPPPVVVLPSPSPPRGTPPSPVVPLPTPPSVVPPPPPQVVDPHPPPPPPAFKPRGAPPSPVFVPRPPPSPVVFPRPPPRVAPPPRVVVPPLPPHGMPPPPAAIPGPSPHGAPSGGGGNTEKSSVVLVVVVSVVAWMALMSLATMVFFCRRRIKRLASPSPDSFAVVHDGDDSDRSKNVNPNGGTANGDAPATPATGTPRPGDTEPVESRGFAIPAHVLHSATNNFARDNVLGRGGFGVVYKGELDDGTMIAVKRMEGAVVSEGTLAEFRTEVTVLTKLRHGNLVAILGYSIQGNERLLVYEYMSRGTLSKHLFAWQELGFEPLSWKQRLDVAMDVAHGMEYLHSRADQCFIHRDLKSANILLGNEFQAKVSDFGLIKLAPGGDLSVATRLAGTFGYLAPEYVVTGKITTKADVFSFGVVLMELITGMAAVDDSRLDEETRYLAHWFCRIRSDRDKLRAAIDPSLGAGNEIFESVAVVAELAGQCTALDQHERPDMGHAVDVIAGMAKKWKTNGFYVSVEQPESR